MVVLVNSFILLSTKMNLGLLSFSLSFFQVKCDNHVRKFKIQLLSDIIIGSSLCSFSMSLY